MEILLPEAKKFKKTPIIFGRNIQTVEVSSRRPGLKGFDIEVEVEAAKAPAAEDEDYDVLYLADGVHVTFKTRYGSIL
jgi:hypothetical protein